MPSKALLIGVNYLMNNEDTLKSPINNIEILRDFLICYSKFDKKNVTLLSDLGDYKKATFMNITSELKKLVNNSNKNDFIFLYFSGYGDFLGIPEKDSDKYIKESMKLKSLYKVENEEHLFLPEDYNMSVLTKKYFLTILNNCNSRIFLFFDCFNKKNNNYLKYSYDINNKTFRTHLDKNQYVWSNNMIILSASNMDKKHFNNFNRVNIINNKTSKFYSIFLLDLIKYLFNYLQININFNTFSYEDLYTVLITISEDINKLDFYSIVKDNKENEKMNKSCCCKEKKLKIIMFFTDDKIIDLNFLENQTDEQNNKNNIDEEIKIKIKYRDKTLAYKNINLERDLKIIKRRYEHLLNKYTTFYKKLYETNSISNFKLLL